MNRRHLLLAVLAAPLAALAQSGRMPKVGYLFSFPRGEGEHLWQACRAGLRELGYVEGRSILLEPRWADGDYKRLPALAEELVRLKPDVILTAAQPVSLAMKKATSTIPIVMATGADPVGGGLVASLARPGGNVTGLSGFYEVMPVKMVELAAAAVPHGARIAIFVDTQSPFARGEYRREIERAVNIFGLRADYFECGTPRSWSARSSPSARRSPRRRSRSPGPCSSRWASAS